jgi:NAD(P)-dependent dehydrogenase (short-subunit alcohol dehydrogenase family)
VRWPRGQTGLKTRLTTTSGKAIALRLAHDGYDVCINDIAAHKAGCDEVVKEIQDLGRKAYAHTADVSNLQEVQELVQASTSELGPLNTMVANAGIAQVKGLLDLTERDFQRMFEVNGTSQIP